MRYAVLCLLLAATPAAAGITDSDAAAMAALSPLAARSQQILATATDALPPDLQAQTREGLLVADSCIIYRANENDRLRHEVVADLIRQGFVADEAVAFRSLYGYPVRDDGTCKHKPAPLLATTGGVETDHHSWPGGLAGHIAFNLEIARDLMARYRAESGEARAFDETALVAAVLWHDWAKQVLYRWSNDGIVSYESKIAGTGAHHIIGLAEAMARRLPTRMIVIQACAHDADERAVISYLRAAAIIARVDPVARGYVMAAAGGGFATDIGPECRISFLSDQNWAYAEPALLHARTVLARLIPKLGYRSDPAAAERFTWWALSYYGADRFDLADEVSALGLLQDLQRRLIAGNLLPHTDPERD